MKLLEMKNNLALEAAKLIFSNGIEVVFIGGTALNSFYTGYRFSEDLDLGYVQLNKKHEVEAILEKSGYEIRPTSFKFRDTISLGGISIKLDVIKYTPKYHAFVEKAFAGVTMKTLALGEFIVDKTITFFTREDVAAMGRDAYDLFAIHKTYGNVISTLQQAKTIIRKNIVTVDYNPAVFERERYKIETAVSPYLRKQVKVQSVSTFLKKLRRELNE